MQNRFQADLAYFTAKLAKQQAESDAFDQAFGLSRIDQAHREATRRFKERAAPRRTWAEQKEAFKAQLDLDRYTAAISKEIK